MIGAPGTQVSPLSSPPYVLRGAYVLDESGSFTGKTDIHVADGRVAAIGPDIRGDGRSIDCSGLWIMPGIFDCHAHPALSSRDWLELLRTPITQWTLEAALHLRRTLECGVTFVRDAGGIDAGIRRSIERGFTVGPRLQLSISILSQTGGQVDGFLDGPGLESPMGYFVPDYPSRPPYLADGPEEVRKATRQILRAGADWVKLCASGAPFTDEKDFDQVEYSVEELRVAVDEALRAGKRVMADSKSPQSIDNCLAAGVHSIEHGVFLGEEQAARMADAGCWLVPTHLVYADLIERAESGALPAHATEKVLELKTRNRAVEIARAFGVKIALGSDAFGRELQGRNLWELTLLHSAGMPVEEVLLTATIRGAELCNVADRYGRIAPGYIFDAIVLDEDPTNLAIFAKPGSVSGVFKNGIPVVEHPRLAELAFRSTRYSAEPAFT